MTYCQPTCPLDDLLLACIPKSPHTYFQQQQLPTKPDIALKNILPKYLTLNEILQHWTWYEKETEQTTLQNLLDEKFEQAKQSGLWATLKNQGHIEQGAIILTLPSYQDDPLYVQDGWHRLAVAQRLQNLSGKPQYLRIIFTFNKNLHHIPTNRSPHHRREDNYLDPVEMLGF